MPRPDHLYQKLLDELRRQVLASFSPGDTLPSQRALAYMHGVGQATVHRALGQLAKEGLTEARPRLGWVRAGKPKTAEASRGRRGPALRAVGVLTRRSRLEVDKRGNPLFGDIEAEARRRGIGTVFHTNPKQHHPTPARNRLELSRVPWNAFDAALLVEVEDALTLGDPLLKRHAVLSVDLDATVYGLSSVTFDDIGAGRLAARHLFELGHRRFAITDEVNEVGWPTEATWTARRHGFEAEVGRLGGVIHPLWRVAVGRHSRGSIPGPVAKESVRNWLNFPPQLRPTALFAVDQSPLAAIVEELAEKNLRVPKDLSMITVGWADSPTDRSGLKYTCIEMDPVALARRALDAAADLAERVAQRPPDAGDPRLYTAPVILVPGTTAVPPPSP